jgi:regulator of cell morphogenesis and NO signaling
MGETLREAMEREHHQIDGGIEEFVGGLADKKSYAGLLSAMNALRRHIYLEEEFLFPPLRESGMMAPIFVMLREHGEMWETMTALDTLLASEPDAGVLRERCDVLLVQLERHNTKEEPIIYSEAEQVLPDPLKDELRSFLDSGELPDGWVCQVARA